MIFARRRFKTSAYLASLCALALFGARPGAIHAEATSAVHKSHFDLGASKPLFEKVAAELEFFDLHPFLYNRPELDFTPAVAGAAESYFSLLNQVLDTQLAVEDIEPLLSHPDPKVRTLALAALFHRGDAHLLPLIVGLAGDDAPTFKGHGELSKAWLARTGIGPPAEKQSVGDVARGMAVFYLKQAGFHFGLAGQGSEPDFNTYWTVRKDRQYGASWFAVALARASRGISPTQPQYRADILAVRQRIEALPAADRDWTLLYLNGEEGSNVLVSEAELMAAARRRGPKELLAVLRAKMPSEDPDLQSLANNNWPYKRLMTWILTRAPQLLRPAMADDILECERSQRDYRKLNITDPFISAAWPVAAARLQRRRGREILKAAWARFNGEYDGENRVLLMAALADQGDAADFNFIATWFFAPPPQQYDGSMGKQASFFSRLLRPQASPRTRRIVARLIHDTRFDSAEFWAVKEAADIINTWSGVTVVDIDQLYKNGGSGARDRTEAQGSIAVAIEKLRRSVAGWK